MRTHGQVRIAAVRTLCGQGGENHFFAIEFMRTTFMDRPSPLTNQIFYTVTNKSPYTSLKRWVLFGLKTLLQKCKNIFSKNFVLIIFHNKRGFFLPQNFFRGYATVGNYNTNSIKNVQKLNPPAFRFRNLFTNSCNTLIKIATSLVLSIIIETTCRMSLLFEQVTGQVESIMQTSNM